MLWHAAQTAGHAPSILDTRPWRWRVGNTSLRLYADRARQLMIADRAGRLLTISCGAALHHARVALAVSGRAVHISRLPLPRDPDLLAEIRLGGAQPVRQEDIDAFAAVSRGRRARRPVSAAAPTREQAAVLTAAAEAQGARLHLLNEDRIAALARYHGSAPVRAGGTVAQLRRLDFGTASGSVAGARFGIVSTDADTPEAWLRTGEAFSAVLLAAAVTGLGCEPVEDAARLPLTGLRAGEPLPGFGHPQLAIQIGQ